MKQETSVINETPQHMNATEAAVSTLLLGRDGDWWDKWMLISLGVAALVAAFVVVFTTGSVRVHKREADAASAALEKYKSTADGRIADAKALGIKAGLDSAEAKAESAQANARAAGFEQEAEQARLEAEKIKAMVAWRTLDSKEAAALESALRAKPGAVNLRWTDGDPEAMYLAIQFANIFTRAGWQVAPGSSKMAGVLPFGIHVPHGSSNIGESIRAAFNAAHLPFDPNPWPQSATAGAKFNVTTVPGAPELYIGSRRPAAFP